MKKTDSKTSIGLPELPILPNKPKPSKPSKPSKPPDKSRLSRIEEPIEDICSVLVFCDKHDKVSIQRLANKDNCFWFPTLVIKQPENWTQTASALLEKIIGNQKSIKHLMAKQSQMVSMFRLNFSKLYTRFVVRVIYLVRLRNKEMKSDNCCVNSETYDWICIHEILNNNLNKSVEFWGPEVQLIVRKHLFRIVDKLTIKPLEEIDETDALEDYVERPKMCATREQTLIRSARFTATDIVSLFDQFVQHCYPSQFMTFSSFKSFVKKSGFKLKESNIDSTFRAFDRFRSSYLSFSDLLLGMAAMDGATEHGGDSGFLRCGYLLRYYDSDSDGFLSKSDLCQMIVDIEYNTNNSVINVDSPSVKTRANQVIVSNGSNGRISSQELTQAIGTLQLRGTSSLFRKSGLTIQSIGKQSSKQLIQNKSNYDSVRLICLNNYDVLCQNCHKRNFQISSRVYKMSKIGEVSGFETLIHNPKIVCNFSEIGASDEFGLALDIINRITKLYTNGVGSNGQSVQKSLDLWFCSTREELITKLLTLCDKTRKLFELEDRVLRLSTPCYIFGDIHGNFKDLMIFSENIWRSSPLINESNYLFLGDYVDRGQYGVECVVYLFALKLMAPNNFWLIRGNHEVRELQEMFTFKAECIDKYNEQIWNAINEVFDRLPIAAVVDHRLFCSHGGIPMSTTSIEELCLVPTPLNDPEVQSKAAWEILWNDPYTQAEFEQLSDFQRIKLQNSNGFLPNVKRRTGFYYSEQAINRFFKHNKIQLIIRGHECVEDGYQFLINGKVVTIFSTSLYCGLKNTASVLFVNYGKVRVIRVHTFD